MSNELNSPLGLCKAQMLAALEVHRHWLENLQCLRQMQLNATAGLLQADRDFASTLEHSSDFNAMFASQLAFVNAQLGMQNVIWQGLMQMSARGPTVWAEQYDSAEKAWRRVFDDPEALRRNAGRG